MNEVHVLKTLLFVLLASVYAAKGDGDKRREANKVAGLMQFPRIGRSGGKMEWPVELYGGDVDRRSVGTMISFPRTGRTSGSSTRPRYLPSNLFRQLALADPLRLVDVGDVQKRNGGGTTGLWFGPRLGRRDKRSSGGGDPEPWTIVTFKDYRASLEPGTQKESRDGDYDGTAADADADFDNMQQEHEKPKQTRQYKR